MALKPFKHPWVIESHKPIYMVRYPAQFTEEQFRAYFDHLTDWVLSTDEPVAWVIEVPNLTASQRKCIADSHAKCLAHETKFCACYAFWVPNILLRNLITAVSWLQPQPWATQVFVKEEQALVWAKKTYAEKYPAGKTRSDLMGV